MRKTPQLLQRSVAALASLALIWPSSAFAATSLTVNGGDPYTEAASGDGWNWDGADDMTLDGYNNGPIAAQGDLIITVHGQNTVTGNDRVIQVEEDETSSGSLVIQGDGTLNVDATGEGGQRIVSSVVSAYDDVTIKDIELNVYSSTGADVDTGIRAGVRTGNDSTLEITNAEVSVSSNLLGMTSESGVISISNSIVDVEGVIYSSDISIDNSHVYAVINEDNWLYSSEDTPVVMASGEDSISLSNVEGDVEILRLTDQYEWPYTYLSTRDGNMFEIQVDPTPEDVTENAIATRTITYRFEDGTEAAPAATDTLDFSRMGKRNPLTSETTWDEWAAQSFADVSSPVIEGYTASVIVVAGTSATAGDNLTYEVVYVKNAEPEVVNPVEEASAPSAPAPSGPQLPKTDDASSGAPVAAMAAGGVSALLAGSVLLRRRPQE